MEGDMGEEIKCPPGMSVSVREYLMAIMDEREEKYESILGERE